MGDDENTSRLRAGDADRDRVVDRLREHHEAGRLTAEEFQQRMEAALAARYMDELPPLLADLPGEESSEQPGSEPDGDGGVPPWAHGSAIPPWARAHAARGWRHGPLVPLVPVLALLALIGSVGALAHGHFPWPLLWVGLLLWWLRPWRHGAFRAHRSSGEGAR
jgi:hypothetical protein